MKRVLDFMMNNKYVIIAFSVVVFSLKILLDNYEVPEQYNPLFATVKTTFLIVFITCVLHVLSLFVFALMSRNSSEAWWENLQKNEKQARREKLKVMYTEGLGISIPLALYGTLVYLAIFQPWKNILIFTIVFAVTRTINYFQNNRKQQVQREL